MPNYTDDQMRTAIEYAATDDAPLLARGRAAYLSLTPQEQALVNRGLRRLIADVPKIGPIMALEICTATVCKRAAREAASQ